MKTINLWAFIVVLLTGCNGSSKQTDQKTITLPLLEIKEKQLYFVFDSIIDFEKKCSYFQDSLYFWVDVYQDRIMFESGLEYVKTLDTKPRGYFIYKNHLFFVHIFERDWLVATNKEMQFVYNGSYEPIIDDSWTMTTYLYENGRFILEERTSLCQ